MSRKKTKPHGKFKPNLQQYRPSYHNQKYTKTKGYKKSAVYKPSLKAAKAKLNVPSPKHIESPKSPSSEGNLLQQYKYYQNYGKLPTEREIAWSNFLTGLEEIPAEIRIKFVQELDYLRYTYGDQVVAYYLDKHSLLDEMSKFSSVDYKSTVAIMYLYKLARGIELAVQGDISDNHYDLRSEAEWAINRTVRGKNQGYFDAMLTDEAIQDINLTIELDKYVDSLWDEQE